MNMEPSTSSGSSAINSDLYFLIVKFLAGGPCKDIAEGLRAELEHRKILPPRLDWLGNEHEQSFQELESKFQHLGSNHLLDLCQRLVPHINTDKSNITSNNWSLLHPIQRSQCESVSKYSASFRGAPFADPARQSITHNVVKLIQGRENTSCFSQSRILTPKFYARQQLFCKTLGHLSSVYCVLFDKTGRYVFTGADDLLVKVWSVHSGRLLATLRGATSEITDIDVNPENTMLAAGSCDKVVRVWCLQTTAPVAVLSSHTGMITSVNFCPYMSETADTRYLVSTSTDGSVAFWSYEHNIDSKLVKFQPKPCQYHERMRPGQAQMICASFSPGGAFLAAGSADHHVRVYHMAEHDGPIRILEKEAHADRVDSIQWSANGLRFISGSKDGTALIWRYEAGDWHSLSLNMYTRLPGTEPPEDDSKQRLKVSMVAWAMNDQCVITAVNDQSLKVWNATTGVLCHVLIGHKDEVFVLEPHPISPTLLLSAGHDGQIILWDVSNGLVVRSYSNTMEGQGHGAVFDAKWSPDGCMAAATDSHGHLLLFGLGTNEKYRNLPKQLFFHTDYRPLIRDANNFVLDEQTQIAPHLMPPPFLVDVDGNPYPPEFQRLVPGRENCRDEQLVPNIIITDDGEQEVIEGLPEPEPQPAPAAPGPSAAGPSPAAPGPSSAVLGPSPAAPGPSSGVPEPSTAGSSSAAPGPSVAGPSTGPSLTAGPTAVNPGVLPPANPAQAAAAAAIARANRLSQQENVAPALAAVPVQPARSNIDEMIEALAREGPLAAERPGSNNQQRPPGTPRQRGPNVVAYRRTGDVEGVRQSRGNWQGANQPRNIKKKYIPLHNSHTFNQITAKNIALAQHELDSYFSERAKPPTKFFNSPQQLPRRPNKRPTNNRATAARNNLQHNYRTRGTRAADEAEVDMSPSSNDESGEDNSSDASSSDCSDSSDDSSEYSDWIADTGANLEPPKRSRRKPVVAAKTRSSQDDESDEEPVAGPSNEAGTSSEAGPSRRDARLRQAPKKTKRSDESPLPSTPAINAAKILGNKKEVPEAYKPSEWLSEVIPLKAPYYPQMGDEVMYFRQGHQQYINAVKTKKVYELGPKNEPWLKRKDIRDQELVKVIGIKYEIKPPRLCCLKLALLNSSTNAMTSTFTIKYHDMDDVIDFLVLKQTYDTAMERNWKPGDQFRCMIDESWWIGTIESLEPFEPDFPDSAYQCFQVRWDNGETERMSPWDLEPVDQSRLPAEIGGSVPVLPAEIQATLYQSKVEDWPPLGDRDGECQRILAGIEQVMSLSAAEPFAAPVDLNQYPSYALIVEYPIDLTMIKSRLENHFYRRVTSVQYDVRFIATNAEKFNQRNSHIVKQARIVTELCLSIIKGHQAVEVSTIYHQMMDSYKSDSDTDNEKEDDEEDSDGGSRKGRAIRRSSRRMFSSKAGPSRPRRVASTANTDPNAWKIRCRDLLDLLWSCQDSEPFREPVDVLEHPDYLQLIDTPMDLGTIREELYYGNYESPADFAKDVRLMFNNSKNYNTNKKSRIYGMTVRLSVLFESRIKPVMDEWRGVKRRQALKSGSKSPSRPPAKRAVTAPKPKPKPSVAKASVASSSSSSSSSRSSSANSTSSNTRPKRQTSGAGPSRRAVIKSEEEDGEDDENQALPEPPKQSQSKPSTSVAASSSNGVQKILIKKTNLGLQTLIENGHIWPPPSSNGKRRAKRLATTSSDDNDGEESDNGPAQASTAESGASTGAAEPDDKNEDSSSESSEDDKSDPEAVVESSSESEGENSEEAESEEEQPKRKRKRRANSSDSEDSYKPVKKAMTTRGRAQQKKKPAASTKRTRRKRQQVCYQEAESEEEGPRRRVSKRNYNEDSDDSDHSKPVVSVSSRGRVRKLTERARNLFRD